MASNFDEFMFMAIKQSKSIEEIVENFFSFLRRHTDFYHTMLTVDEVRRFNLDTSVNSRGFRPNQMVNLVNKIINDNLLLYRRAHQPYLVDYKSTSSKTKDADPESYRDASSTKHPSLSKHSRPSTRTNGSDAFKVGTGGSNDNTGTDSDLMNKQNLVDSGTSCSKGQEKPSVGDLKYTINPWNGAITKKYSWTQSFKELTVEIVSPERLSSKNVSVTMTKSKLTVKILGQVVVDGELCRHINNHESVWTIEDGSRVLISIEKSEEYWWDCVIKGDERIDTQEVESVKRLEEFTESEQNAILKMMSDHRKKNNM